MRRHFIVALSIFVFVSCKKDTPVDDPVTPPSAASGTTEELIADSVFLFSKEIYYWQDEIGAVSYETFNPRQYVTSGDALATAESVMEAIRKYNTYDKAKGFSYAEAYQDGSVSSKAETHYNKDYGFNIKAAWKSRTVYSSGEEKDPNFDGWYVTYVFPNSAAGKAGITRGMKVTKIGTTAMGYTNVAINAINDMFYYQTITSTSIELQKPDGTSLSTTLSLGSYIPTSVLQSKVLTSNGGNKVGYLVYKFFDDLDNSQTDIDQAIQSFKDAGTNNIIIDLRYNNGGFTATQDYLSNQVAPRSVNGSVMYQLHFNTNLQTGNYTITKNRYPNYKTFSLETISGMQKKYNTEYFSTSGSLNTSKIYFIISNSTASSAELLINNLKASGVLGNNVILIGDGNTYGKPVGFFPVDLFKKITFWTVSFMTKNNAGDSVSYNGFNPDYEVYDGVDKAWGDVTEECLKTALDLIDGKTVATTSAAAPATIKRSVAPSLTDALKKKPDFYDRMIYTK